MAQIIIVMGVSGSGKTTVGTMLARELGCEFYDADDFHSTANREKMSQGLPLTDEDRADWLNSLQNLIQEKLEKNSPCVLACSALKQVYREQLSIDESIRFVYLHGTYDQIETRMKRRQSHYMPVELLKSQFETLEEPTDALYVDISKTPEEIVQIIRKGITP